MDKRSVSIQVSMLPDYWDSQIVIPDVQREDTAWTREQQQLLIDSLYNNFDIPKFYLRDDIKHGESKWLLLDGQQRLTAILKFLRGEFAMPDSPSVPSHVRSKPVLELRPEDKAKVTMRTLDFVILSCTEDEEEDLFLRLNKGTPLSAAEKRHAIRGEARDLAIDLAKHRFFKSKVSFQTKRYQGEAICAQLILLAMNGAPCDLKGGSLNQLYVEKPSSS